jgi:NitT/TauT family transport system substrate-binding protein
VSADRIAGGSSKVLQVLLSGELDLAQIGGTGIVDAYLAGADPVYITTHNPILVMQIFAVPGIAHLEDLRGKSIAVTPPGSSPSVAMVEVLRRYGMDADRDVNLVYMRDGPAAVAALLSGTVDAMAQSSPEIERVVAEGYRVLLDMRELNVPILGPQLATTRGTLERDPDLLRRFMMAYVDGLQYSRDYPDQAVDAIMKGTRTDNRAESEDGYRQFRDVWSPFLSEAAIQPMLDNSDLPEAQTARPAEMIDDRILRDLERSGWLAAHYSGP